jgi:hypothetical protein
VSRVGLRRWGARVMYSMRKEVISSPTYPLRDVIATLAGPAAQRRHSPSGIGCGGDMLRVADILRPEDMKAFRAGRRASQLEKALSRVATQPAW